MSEDSLRGIRKALEEVKSELTRDQVVALENLIEALDKLDDYRGDLDFVGALVARTLLLKVVEKMFIHLLEEDFDQYDQGLDTLKALIGDIT